MTIEERLSMKIGIVIGVIALSVCGVSWGKTPEKDFSVFVVPVRGGIGVEVTAGLFLEYDKYIRRRKPNIILLEIDSTGGTVKDMRKILKTLDTWNNTAKLMAHVNNEALSAAAVIAMACQEIYMAEHSTIGATLAYYRNKDGKLAVLNEKFASRDRAIDRSAAAMGGHDPLFADAMGDPSMEVFIRNIDGKPVLSKKKGPDSQQLIAKDKLLTLSSNEAVKYGLAKAIVEDRKDMYKQANIHNPTVFTEGKIIFRNRQQLLQKNRKAIERSLKIIKKEEDASLKAEKNKPVENLKIVQRMMKANRNILRILEKNPELKGCDELKGDTPGNVPDLSKRLDELTILEKRFQTEIKRRKKAKNSQLSPHQKVKKWRNQQRRR